MSEELENSLQQAVETYLNDRLKAINEQVSRLQSEVGEALERLRENSGKQNLEGTALSAAIFAHLQTARGQRLSGATASPSVSRDARAIKDAVEAIGEQQTQTDILSVLLKGAVQFAERVALFVIKNNQAIGWRVCKASDPASLEMIGGVSLPLSTETIVTRAAVSRSSQSADQSSSEDQLLIDQLGGEPQSASAVPLIARGKVVAVLYADSTSSETGAINSDALEVLARVAAMGVNLVSVNRATSAPREAAVTQTSEPAAAASAEPVVEAQPTYTPQIEPQTEEVQASPATEAAVTETAPQIEAAPATGEAAIESVPEIQAPPAETLAAPPAEAVTEEPATDLKPIEPEPAVQLTPPAPSFASEYAAPLGSARRYGVSEPELPIEVSDEERRLHNDARRFARLLVSEIKLYNEPKVKEGRSNGDLYERLREDIDRSRQMYDKRVAPPVAARHDYFHQELVNTLAEGDPDKLGANYPGAAMIS